MIAGAVLLVATQARANCGLENCPADPIDAEGESARWSTSVELRETETQYLGIPTSYNHYVPWAEVRWDRWRSGAVVPMISLHFLGETRTGLGNPIFFAQGRITASEKSFLDAGVQFEAPWGDSEEGLADDHAMLVPYVSSQWGGSLVELDGSVGYRFVVYEDTPDEVSDAAAGSRSDLEGTRAIQFHAGHDHGVAETVVDPHTDREMLWRLRTSSGRPLWRITPSLLLDGQVVVGEAVGGSSFTNAGLEVRVRMTRAIALESAAVWPISDARRYDRRLAIALRWN